MSLKSVARKLFYVFMDKHSAELRYWKKCYTKDQQMFSNQHYAQLMLSMADEANAEFMEDKVVADFGCGPRGTLAWIPKTRLKIGIDVLTLDYLKHFGASMKTHGMLYLASTEDIIPLPDSSVDILYSMNSLDHVADLPKISAELQRILKPGGELIGSFNLNNSPTKAEPQSLSAELLKQSVLKGFKIKHLYISAPNPKGYLYQPLIDRKFIDPLGGEAIMWVRASKN
jgi:ubiquinone/menaquinone biosynthesis C-methylase UbiE